MATAIHDVEAKETRGGNLARDADPWGAGYGGQILTSDELGPSPWGPTRVASIYLTLGDPTIAPSLSTGGIFPILGEWRSTVGELDEGLALATAVVLEPEPIWIHSATNVSASPGWAQTLVPFDWPGLVALDLYAALLCGPALAPADDAVATHARWLAELLYETKRRALSPLGGPAPSPVAVPLESLQQSPTAAAASEIRDMLAWSDTQLAGLFRLTRQAWRDWASGQTTPRARNRRRLYLLRHLLHVRRSMASDSSVAEWFESPIGAGRSETPADLFRGGSDNLVAALAAATQAPEATPILLEGELELGGLIDVKAAEARMRDAAAIGAEDRT